jgi:fumarylacetoacetate (FAA) hydrolase family protein
MQVDKGAIFDIGEAATLLKEMAKIDDQNAELAARLIMAKVAAEPTPEIVATIEAELEFDRKHEAGLKEIDDAAAVKATGAMFADLIAQASRLAQRTPAPARAR